ncbi:MAG TPA: GAF domain-containing protein [Gemmatimonadaceae bacterium]
MAAEQEIDAPTQEQGREGDYRPAQSEGALTPGRTLFHPHAVDPKIRLEPLQLESLQRIADALNTTLDLNTLMHRVADLVRAVIDYRIFAILLLHERTQELRMRFQTGHTPDVERLRVKVGRGISGTAALERRSILVDDVNQVENYIDANSAVRSELAIPLIAKNKVIGVLDLQSEHPAFFTQSHREFLELTASRMAIAIENARLYTRVTRQAQTLTVLHEISREITSILDPDDLLERIGTLLKRVIDFQMFTILLWNERTEQFEHRFSTRYGERIVRERNVALGQGLIGTAAQQRVPVLSPDVRKDPRYLPENLETRSELSVPLIYKGNVIGVIDLEHTRVNYYTEEHQRTLTTLAAQVAISIANARLYQRIHDEEQRMERDLNMAHEVQLRLLPSSPPTPAHAEIAASFSPARSIGGDVYDFIDYGAAPNPDLEDPDAAFDFYAHTDAPNTRTLIALGDVSGKAAPAALYAALVSGILRSLAPQRVPPARLLSALNEQLQVRRLDSQYVTMLTALWDDSSRTMHVANAGSVQPLLVTRIPPPGRPLSLTNALEVRTIEVEGFPLGLFPVAAYDEMALALVPGDMVVFFSDGIVDAVNSRGEQFGTDRLSTLLQHHPTASRSAQEAVDAILEAVVNHQAGTEHFDDETIVVLRAR